MKLIDVIGCLGELDGESTIYAAMPWTQESEAIVAREPESTGVRVEAERLGMKYFLEVFVARDFIEDWRRGIEVPPTLSQMCARLIEYATADT